MLKRPCLSLEDIITITGMTAAKNGLEPPTEDEILNNYETGRNVKMPVIAQCYRGTIWVDRYYIAYQVGTGDIHYTYLTREHIKEEVDAFNEAGAEMPEDIRHCFMTGFAWMKKEKKKLWVVKSFRDKLKYEC